MSVIDKANTYLAARQAYDLIHKESQATHKAMKMAEYDLIDAMLNESAPSIGLDIDGDGEKDVTISLRKQVSCSVTKENEDEIRNWLVEMNGSDEDFIVEKVHKPALLEWLRERVGEDMTDESVLPASLKFSTRPGLQVRGLNSKG